MDRLTFLRDKYTTEITAKQAEVADLRHKLSLLEQFEADSTGFKFDNAKPQQPAINPAKPIEANGSHPATAGLSPVRTGLTEKAFEAVKMLSAGGQWTSAPEVKRNLEKNGFAPVTKNFTVRIGTTLTRLATQGRIQTRSSDGHRLYTAK